MDALPLPLPLPPPLRLQPLHTCFDPNSSRRCVRLPPSGSSQVGWLKSFNHPLSVNNPWRIRAQPDLPSPFPTGSLPSLQQADAVNLAGGFKWEGQVPQAAGVYAVMDEEGQVQYIGLSRKLLASLQVHAETQPPHLCARAKFAVVCASSREEMVGAWKSWMEVHVAATGELPTGNQPGNTDWSSPRRTARTKPDVRLTPGRNMALNVPITELIAQVVKEFDIVVFIKGSRTSPQCGFSQRIVTLLNQQGVGYESLDVLDEEHNPGLRDAIKDFSQWPTIPQVYVNGEFIGGADILEEMDASGQLTSLLQPLRQKSRAASAS
eukprot:TRINITY_DN18525_c0_g1_i1.p1 TRINITY_DN18525_c0_g1~~TRINITY_DN18525_c0_g1_i1.p1  ORF type:complete len:330 (+),score=85.25 TRINITY_DN18525_c0_g1_i1:27-992(+)